MKLSYLTPMLTVTDMNSTIQFYQEMLGFECINRSASWATLVNHGVEIMISLPNAHVAFEKAQFTGSLYIRLENVDGLWEWLKARTTVVYPIENFFYGMREFAILDNNGYMLQFGSKIHDPSQIPPSAQD